ncbi:MAG: 2-amino-4-hydroxy-6-hydroxymethyldihydropteridine diphosphokinase [Bacteroidales bacterium]|nr:2-amino-4-hydroxy-6-hydroxymethyldihydropteridine diphosphokinase [Bacteroidales bacterium]
MDKREKTENLLILSFGANLGERKKNIETAYGLIEKRIGKMIKKSSFFETEPWGFDSQNLFINSVAGFVTVKNPFDCLKEINCIEALLGRERLNEAGYSSRTMDIDIIFYNDLVIETKELIIPHPLMHKRNFVLEPLKEIYPQFIHPLLKKAISDIIVE